MKIPFHWTVYVQNQAIYRVALPFVHGHYVVMGAEVVNNGGGSASFIQLQDLSGNLLIPIPSPGVAPVVERHFPVGEGLAIGTGTVVAGGVIVILDGWLDVPALPA